LHNQCGVLVALFAESVQLGNSIVECLLGEMAGLVRGVQDLVVKDREVQRETKSDGVGGSKLGLSDFCGSLVGLERLVRRFLALVGSSELSEVAVVVALPSRTSEEAFEGGGRGEIGLHLVVEHLRFTGLGRGNQVLVQNLEDVFADLSELLLNCLTVFLDEFDLSFVAFRLLLLLDGGDDSPRSATSSDDILVSDREEISLFDGELLVCRGDDLHVLDHFCSDD
jgi:hypothetical protein